MSIAHFLTPKYLLLLICLLFLSTRLYKISEVPPSVYWDEASIGYNAYSIAKDGKDEWGDFLPLHFRAFGEFKLPVYIYSTVPVVKIFGLNEFSVRLPSVLFSLGVVIITFLLGKKITGNNSIGLWGSFFITISPWFFIFSRTGFEVTAGVLFYLYGIYFFISQKKSWYLLVSTVSFILSAYSYNSFRIIIPLTILILIASNLGTFKEKAKKNLFPIILSLLLVIISVIPIYRLYAFDAGFSRLHAIEAKEETYITNYLSHFGFDFLFGGDKNLRSQQKEFGQLFLAELILILIGIFIIIKTNKKNLWLPLILFIIGPIPSALTREAPHALRAISSVPFIAIISAIGVSFLQQKIKQKSLFSAGIIIIFFLSFIIYYSNFIFVYPLHSSQHWQIGYKKIFTDYGSRFDKYEKIIVSDEYAQPYIFALFYLNYDPNKFRKEAVRNPIDKQGFSSVSKIGKFEFRKIDSISDAKLSNALIFASGKEEVFGVEQSDTIRFLDGRIAFKVYRIE